MKLLIHGLLLLICVSVLFLSNSLLADQPVDTKIIEGEVTMKYTRLYVDEDGESHFEDVVICFTEIDFAPPAPPMNVSEFFPAKQYGFLTIPAGMTSSWHPTPKRQVFFYLAGEIEAEVSDGEVRRFGPGSVTLVEDTHGKGHTSRVVGTDDVLLAVVQLD